MLAYPRYEVCAYGCTDVGCVRRTNEDSFFAADLTEGTGIESSSSLRFSSGPYGSLFAVADGMGGAAAGELASRLCLQTFYSSVLGLVRKTREPRQEALEQILIQAVADANTRVLDVSHSRGDCEGMGTTLTAAFELHGSLVIGQIGDSRAYLISEDGIRQLTRDQSMIARLISEGALTEEQARHHPDRNILLQALGVRSSVELALKNIPLCPHDILLLCSDGLYTQLRSQEICDIVLDSVDISEGCLQLVDVAIKRGGPDNITSLLVQFLPA